VLKFCECLNSLKPDTDLYKEYIKLIKETENINIKVTKTDNTNSKVSEYSALHTGMLYIYFSHFKTFIALIASEEGHQEVVKLLIENDADLNLKDNIGETSLHKGIK
jgi:hypothetical protein